MVMLVVKRLALSKVASLLLMLMLMMGGRSGG